MNLEESKQKHTDYWRKAAKQFEREAADLRAENTLLRELFLEGFNSGSDFDLEEWEKRAKEYLGEDYEP